MPDSDSGRWLLVHCGQRLDPPGDLATERKKCGAISSGPPPRRALSCSISTSKPIIKGLNIRLSIRRLPSWEVSPGSPSFRLLSPEISQDFNSFKSRTTVGQRCDRQPVPGSIASTTTDPIVLGNQEQMNNVLNRVVDP